MTRHPKMARALDKAHGPARGAKYSLMLSGGDLGLVERGSLHQKVEATRPGGWSLALKHGSRQTDFQFFFRISDSPFRRTSCHRWNSAEQYQVDWMSSMQVFEDEFGVHLVLRPAPGCKHVL